MTTRPEDISTVVGLFRVSTEAQEKEGFSLAAQQTAFERDCRAFKWRSLGVFQGQETGSALSERKIIHEVIDTVRIRHPDAIWTIEQSRLTRGDELDVALLLRELREHGTKVVVERGTVIDPSDLEGAFVFRLKALMDRREWEVIAARNKRGKDEKAKRGLLVHSRPAYGYTTTGEGKEKGKRVPVPNEASVVKKIFEWAAGGLSTRKIVRRLFEEGIPAPAQAGHSSSQKPHRYKNGIQLWGLSTIKRLLDNPIYIGVSYRHCWLKKGKSFVFEPTNPNAIWVEDAHESIVSKSLWDAAHRQVEAQWTRRHVEIHMLTGVLLCPGCGKTFTVTISNDRRGHKRTYYFCSSKRHKPDVFGDRKRSGAACKFRWLPLDKTDKQMWDALVRLISSPEMVEQFLSSADAERKRQRLQTQLVELTNEAQRIEQMMARAREKLLTEILTDGEYLRERERFQTMAEGITRRLTLTKSELKVCSKEAAMQVIQNLALLKLGEKKLTKEQRSRLFHSLVKRVVPRDKDLKEVEIELYVSPLNETRSESTPEVSLRAQGDEPVVCLSVALA